MLLQRLHIGEIQVLSTTSLEEGGKHNHPCLGRPKDSLVVVTYKHSRLPQRARESDSRVPGAWRITFHSFQEKAVTFPW